MSREMALRDRSVTFDPSRELVIGVPLFLLFLSFKNKTKLSFRYTRKLGEHGITSLSIRRKRPWSNNAEGEKFHLLGQLLFCHLAPRVSLSDLCVLCLYLDLELSR